MKEIIQLIRMKEWLFSKIPFMLLPLLIHMIIKKTQTNDIFILVSFFIYIFCFYGFGYAINDYSDIEADRLVGKTNIMGKLSYRNRIIVLGILTAGGLQFAIIIHNITAFILLLFVYFMGAVYSVRPFRFKERGIAGVIVSSAAQRSIPFIPLIVISKDVLISVVLCSLTGFLVGMRYILIHQYEDIKNDSLSDTNTYVKERNINISKIIYVSLILELLLIITLEILRIPQPLGMIFCIICILQSLFNFYTVQFLYKKEYFKSFICVPLEDMYNFYMPLSLLIAGICENLLFILPTAILLILTIPNMCSKWKMAVFGITHRR